MPERSPTVRDQDHSAPLPQITRNSCKRNLYALSTRVFADSILLAPLRYELLRAERRVLHRQDVSTILVYGSDRSGDGRWLAGGNCASVLPKRCACWYAPSARPTRCVL